MSDVRAQTARVLRDAVEEVSSWPAWVRQCSETLRNPQPRPAIRKRNMSDLSDDIESTLKSKLSSVRICQVFCTAHDGDCDCMMCFREDGQPKLEYDVVYHDPWKDRSLYIIRILESEQFDDHNVSFGYKVRTF